MPKVIGNLEGKFESTNRVYDINDDSPTLNTCQGGDRQPKIVERYRIRRLTPRECGRLMGVSDEDINKMQNVNSDSQLYKQFGNSIVVDVMCAMFEELNLKKK